MERIQKKEEQKAGAMSPVQLAKVMGNQAVMQRMWSDDDTEWTPGPEDVAREQEDLLLPEETYKWRQDYGGFTKSKYDAFKAANLDTGCAHGAACRNPGYGYDDSGPWVFSIDHIDSVFTHWNSGGSRMTYEERHEWYNDETNWQPMHLSCNASKGR